MQLEPTFTLPTRWPLVPVDVAAFFLDLTAEEIRLQADSLWAWDIAAPGRDRRVLRIWRESLLAQKNLRRKVPTHHHEVLATFLPKRGLRGKELQDLFYCTPQHVAELEADRQIIVERNRLAMCGPNASPRFNGQRADNERPFFLAHKEYLESGCARRVSRSRLIRLRLFATHPDSMALPFGPNSTPFIIYILAPKTAAVKLAEVMIPAAMTPPGC